MVTIFAVINTRGKMEQMSVRRSPDPRLDVRIISALEKWVFRPALLDGEPVAVETLFGVPLWLPDQPAP